MNKLVIRYQIGPFGEMSWRALQLSVCLMQRTILDAGMDDETDILIVHQGPMHPVCGLSNVTYHAQENLYSHGRFAWPEDYPQPVDAHVLVLENDHIMWAIPPGMTRWLTRSDATLAWIVDWDYYGNYADRVGGFRACPGMYGLPPGVVMPSPPIEERGDDQAEQGYIAAWLKEHPPHEIVTHDEVAAYMPNHDILRHTHSKLGTHGVHLPGLNRGWSRGAEELIVELERKYL